MKSTSLIACLAVMTGATLLSFTDPPATSTANTEALVADWQRAKAFTQEYLDAMPADKMNYKPTPEMRSFAEQMLHLAQGNINIVATSTGKSRPYADKQLEKLEEFKTKEAVNKVVQESYDFVIGTLKEMDDDKLSEKVKFFNNQEYTRAVGIGKAFEHQTHHRGQTTVYLRMNGVTPPNEKLF
ncbi:MAG: DinB family protein [Bacteroidia bacterium]|nr:DinB family protein [Bacteroidia bacterium]